MTFLHVRPGSPEYLEAVRGKITGSLAADILCPGEPGVHGNPLSAWMRITGRDTEPLEDNDSLLWGRESEELHARLLAKKAGVQVVERSPGLAFDSDLPWLGGSPDVLATNQEGEPGVLELKAPSDFRSKTWLQEGVPLGYAVQLTVYMRVLRVPWGIASALVPPSPVWQRIHHSPDMEAWVIEGLTRFYEDHVKRDVAPDLDERWLSARTLEDIKSLCVPKPGLAMQVDESHPVCAIAIELERAKADIKAAEERKLKAEQLLIGSMGEAERLYLPDGSGYTRKKQVTNYKPMPARTVESVVMRYHREMK